MINQKLQIELKRNHRKIVKLGFDNGASIKGILYEGTMFYGERLAEGVYLITFRPEDYKIYLLNVEEWELRNKTTLIEARGTKIMDSRIRPKLREYERKLDEDQKEKFEFFEKKKQQKRDEHNKKTDKELRSEDSIKGIKDFLRDFEGNNKGLGL